MAKKKEVKVVVKKDTEQKEEVKVEAPIVSGLKRVKVTQEELMKLQDEHKLVGYDPATKEALIN